jgi:hypothetical protein
MEQAWRKPETDESAAIGRRLRPAMPQTVFDEIEKVLPFITSGKERSASAVFSGLSKRDWSDALDLVHQAVDAVRTSRTRAEELESYNRDFVERAKEELNAARLRIEATETRAKDAEARVRETELRAREADARVRELEVLAQAAEARARDWEGRAKETEIRLKDTETRAREAEVLAEEATGWLQRLNDALVTGFATEPR